MTKKMTLAQYRSASKPFSRRNKFGAKREAVDGITFDSKAEAKRYGELKLLVRARKIKALTIHPRFKMAIGGVPICVYEADFQYLDVSCGICSVVEDVKGVRTPAYIIKRKLFLALYPQHRHVEISAK